PAVAGRRPHEGVTGQGGVAGLEAGGPGIPADQLVVVVQNVRMPVGPVERGLRRAGHGHELRHGQDIAGGDGQVVGADAVAASEGGGVIEAGRVGEAAVDHPVARGGGGHVVGEGGQVARGGVGQGVGGVVGRHHHQRVEGGVPAPLLAGHHADPHGRLGGGVGPDGEGGAGG